MRKFLTAVLFVGVTALSCNASPIGVLDIAGLGNIRVSVDRIDFGPGFGDGTGTIVVTNGTGGFASVPLGAIGQITDLSTATAPPGVVLSPPVTPFIQVPFPGAQFVFNLEQIQLGGGPSCATPPAVGQSCSPTEILPNTPFLLSQKQGSVVGAMSVLGTVTEIATGQSAPYAGLFTFNLTVQKTIPEVLAAFAPGGPGFVESSWSAEFNAVPEPGTISMLLGAFGVMAIGAFRKRQ